MRTKVADAKEAARQCEKAAAWLRKFANMDLDQLVRDLEEVRKIFNRLED